MKEPIAVVIYETSDGRNFPTLEEAKRHEEVLKVVAQYIQGLYDLSEEPYGLKDPYVICKWFVDNYDLIPRVNVAS